MELLDIVDENNNLTGEFVDREIVHSEGLLHREVGVIILNENNEMLLEKGASTKKQSPNKWALCAGHIEAGDTPENAILREVKEEIGIDITKNDLIVTIVNRGYTDAFMEAALTAGARGGTVLHARGAGTEEASQFFGITIQPEKEMVLILVDHDSKIPVMQAITRNAGLNTEGHGLVFSLPVSDVMGIARVTQEQTEDAE